MSDMMTQEDAMHMSNEQAVQILIPMRNMMCDQHGCPISNAVFALDKAIEVLSAQPTLYGYNIEHLDLIARVLQRENLPPERVTEILTDIGRIVSIVIDEFEESLKKAVEQTERRER